MKGFTLCRTPIRISLFGGGSDIPKHYRSLGHHGNVISMTIDKFIWIAVNDKFGDKYRLSYSKTENVTTLNELEHDRARESLKLVGIDQPVEVVSVADIPSNGSGMGSSSAYTVGLINAASSYLGHKTTCTELAEKACRVEIDILGHPIGKQDQYAAAFGGFNLISFGEHVTVHPVPCNYATIRHVLDHLLLLHTGVARSASKILGGKDLANREWITDELSTMAVNVHRVLSQNTKADLGPLMHEAWLLKKRTQTNVTNAAIDSWYDKAMTAGASGGKILGAGGGGFLLFWADHDRHDAIVAATGLKRVPFDYWPYGSRIEQ